MTESSQKCPPADKPVSDRPTVSELRKAAQEARTDAMLHHDQLHNLVCKNAIDAIADSWHEAQHNWIEQSHRLQVRAEKAEREVEKLTSAIRWALGEEGDFMLVENSLSFWWRAELRKRAALRGDK